MGKTRKKNKNKNELFFFWRNHKLVENVGAVCCCFDALAFVALVVVVVAVAYFESCISVDWVVDCTSQKKVEIQLK